jgi:hypothetical protein
MYIWICCSAELGRIRKNLSGRYSRSYPPNLLQSLKKTKRISVITAVSRMRFEHGTSRMRSRSSNYSNSTVRESGVKNNNPVAWSGQYVSVNTIKPVTSLVTSREQRSETNGDVTRADSASSLGGDVTV